MLTQAVRLSAARSVISLLFFRNCLVEITPVGLSHLNFKGSVLDTLGVDRLAHEKGSTRSTARVRFRNFIFLKKSFMISNFTESDLIATLRSNRVEIFLKSVRFDLAIR